MREKQLLNYYKVVNVKIEVVTGFCGKVEP